MSLHFAELPSFVGILACSGGFEIHLAQATLQNFTHMSMRRNLKNLNYITSGKAMTKYLGNLIDGLFRK